MNTIKDHRFFNIICLVLIITFISLDIAYAYPTEHTAQNSTVATPSVFQGRPVTTYAEEFQRSMFADGNLLGTVCSIGKFLLEDGIKLRHLARVLGEELGDAAEHVDLSKVSVIIMHNGALEKLDPLLFVDTPRSAVILIPYKDRKKGIIEIALKDNPFIDKLPGYRWIVSDDLSDMYTIKELPADYKGPALQSATEAKTKTSAQPTISEPIARVEVPLTKTEKASGVTSRSLNIRAIILPSLLIALFPLSVFAGTEGASNAFLLGSATSSIVQDFAFTPSVIKGIAALVISIVAILIIWWPSPLIKWHMWRLGSAFPHTRSAAAEALKQIGWKPANIDEEIRFNMAAGDWSALVEMGTPAVPALVAASKNKNSDIRVSAALTLKQIGWEPANIDEEIIFNIAAGNWSALVKIGAPAVPYLVRMLNDDNYYICKFSAQSLESIADPRLSFMMNYLEAIIAGPEYYKALKAEQIEYIAYCLRNGIDIEALYAGYRSHKVEVIKENDFFSSTSYVLVVDLRAKLVINMNKDISPRSEKQTGTTTLMSVDPFAAIFGIAALSSAFSVVENFASAHPIIAMAAGIGIGFALYLSAWRAYSPANWYLFRARFTRNKSVIINALVKIGAPAVPTLIKALESSNSNVRWLAIYVLGKIGPVTDKVVPALVKKLGDRDGNVRSIAAGALIKINDTRLLLMYDYLMTMITPGGHDKYYEVLKPEEINYILECLNNNVSIEGQYIPWIPHILKAQLNAPAVSPAEEVAPPKAVPVNAPSFRASQLFEIVESSLNSRMSQFIEAGDSLINLANTRRVPEGFSSIGNINQKMATAGIVQRVEWAIEALDKEGVAPEIKTAIESLKKDINQFEADSTVASLIVLARRAKREDQKLIIGLETDWIPGINIKDSCQKQAIFALMKEIDSLGDALKSMGLDNVEIIRGSGKELADTLLDKAGKTRTNLRNIVVMASSDTINSDSFAALRDADENDRPFLAGIDPKELIKFYSEYGESTSNQLYIKLTQLLHMTLELASGKELMYIPMLYCYDRAKRIVIFMPRAELKDYEALKKIYMAEKAALVAA